MIQYIKNLHYNTHNNFSRRFYALLILINSYEKKFTNQQIFEL